jgi:hypothetical protein
MDRYKKMKRTLLFCAMLAVAFIATPFIVQAQCTRIKDGTLLDSNGNLLTLGFDQFGYNYQARMFNGTYDSADRNNDGKYFGTTTDYTDDTLIMKWSEDWLSNQDCNHDGKLDRGGEGGAGNSKGWTTNHVEGDYIGPDGEPHHYTYFVKIVWVGPAPSGTDPWAGKRIWTEFAIIEEVYNDPDGGYHGVDRSRLTKPGLGFYTN